MLGPIEELEKDIERFQNNIAASSEMVELLQHMLEQLKAQNESFNSQSGALIARLDSVPKTINDANTASNVRIQSSVSTELENALRKMAAEQEKYSFLVEQSQRQIQTASDQSAGREKIFKDSADTLVAKVEMVPEQIKRDNATSQMTLQTSIDTILERRNALFSQEQGRYISTVESATAEVKRSEQLITDKYRDFLQTLERTNIADIYDQVQQLKSDFSKKITLLMGISIIGIVVGILGILF